MDNESKTTGRYWAGITLVQLGIRKVGAFLFPTQVHVVNEETEKANVEESVMF